jgi:spore coat protein U-like protein
LNYGLTSVSATGVNWGADAATGAVAGTGTGAAQDITIFGREPAGQFVTPGAFADTITATVTY